MCRPRSLVAILVLFVVHRVSGISLTHPVGVRPIETLKLFVHSMTIKGRQGSYNVYPMSSIHQGLSDLSLYICRPLFQFWVGSEVVRKCGHEYQH